MAERGNGIDNLAGISEGVEKIDIHVEETRSTAKRVFNGLMNQEYRSKTENKLQPCSKDLEYLEGSGKELCKTLKKASLREFCDILHPIVNEVPDEDIIRKSLADSIFHVHTLSASIYRNFDIFKDQTKRAEALAKEIKRMRINELGKITCRILDGHGRMLLCLIRAMIDEGLDPDEVLKLEVYEIDEDVHAYHKFVFPTVITCKYKSIIDDMEIEKSVVYLNFCSVPSRDNTSLKAQKEKIQARVNDTPIISLNCDKENVLKYIWHMTQNKKCLIMISSVIKHQQKNAIYQTQDNFINGLGFVHILRLQHLFDTIIVSIQPYHIVWEDENIMRNPQKMQSGARSSPVLTVLIKPKRNHLFDLFESWNIPALELGWD